MGTLLRRLIVSCSLVGMLVTGGCPSRPQKPQTPDTATTTPTNRKDPSEVLARHRARLARESKKPLTRVAPERLLTAIAAPSAASAPLSLTASDGTGLVLSRMKASAVVEGPLAFTELELDFENPEDRVLEGRFTITLPVGAAVSRFAMLMADGWREAEVVERQRARAAYEDFLHRRQDPALLEREAGNQFSARVFPIPARGTKQLKISYSQELAETEKPYHLPLAGLPKLGRLEIIAIAGDEITSVIKENLAPTEDFEIRVPQKNLAAASGLHSERIAMARVKISAPASQNTTRPLDSVLFLVDTSASRAPGFDKQLELVAALAEEVKKAGPAAALQVAAFDQSVASIYDGPAANFSAQAIDALRRRGPLGASDLEAALAFVKSAGPKSRVVLFTDGITTAGGGASELRTAVSALAPRLQRLDVVMVGGIRDEVAMRTLATAPPEAGLVLDGTQPVDLIARKLHQPVYAKVGIAVAGALWHWPQALEGVLPGDEALIYAELPDGHPGQSLEVKLQLGDPKSNEPALTAQVPLAETPGPLLERAFAQALVQSLTQKREELLKDDPKAAANLRTDIIELSTQHRVLSDFTALLVLETEQDYARFQLDRRALADILTVSDHGLELMHRTQTKDPGAIAATNGAANPSGSPSPSVTVNKQSGRAAPTNQDIALARPAASAPRDEAPDAVPDSGRVRAAMESDRDAAAKSGVLSLLRDRGEGNMASIFGRDSTLGADAEQALGGLIGTEVGDAYGAGGLGLVGAGRGGGGTGEGTIGIGRIGTVGRGSGSGGQFGSREGGVRGVATPGPGVEFGTAEVRGSLDKEIIRRIIRRHTNELKFCYERELTRHPDLQGRLLMQFTINATGNVNASNVVSSTLGNNSLEQCVRMAVLRWEFPVPAGGIVVVNYPFVFNPTNAWPSQPRRIQSSEWEPSNFRPAPEPKPESVPAYTGVMLEVMNHILHGRTAEALQVARAWRSREPGDVLALTALGEAYEKAGNTAEAERAYGSIIDLFPSRADLRRYAGARLERTGKSGLVLAADTYKRAAEQRPDHPSSHRLYAYALLKLGKPAEAFAALRTALVTQYPANRFRGVDRIVREDLGLCAAAWRKAEPTQAGAIEKQLGELGIAMSTTPSLRFVLNWETDANDVDFHIHDGKGGHAYFQNKVLRSGGELYADVTTGYGPECFTIYGTPTAFPYRLEAHYYSRGPMGYGMGKLEILQHDGKGGLRFLERPFVVMNNNAYVDMGTVEKPL